MKTASGVAEKGETSATYITLQTKAVDSGKNKTEITIPGDIFGLNEFEEFDAFKNPIRTASAVAVSQVKVLKMPYKIYRQMKRASQGDDQRQKMHFFRTCHMDTLIGRMAEKHGGFSGILPLLKDRNFPRGEIIATQGFTCDQFFILRTGIV